MPSHLSEFMEVKGEKRPRVVERGNIEAWYQDQIENLFECGIKTSRKELHELFIGNNQSLIAVALRSVEEFHETPPQYEPEPYWTELRDTRLKIRDRVDGFLLEDYFLPDANAQTPHWLEYSEVLYAKKYDTKISKPWIHRIRDFVVAQSLNEVQQRRTEDVLMKQVKRWMKNMTTAYVFAEVQQGDDHAFDLYERSGFTCLTERFTPNGDYWMVYPDNWKDRWNNIEKCK